MFKRKILLLILILVIIIVSIIALYISKNTYNVSTTEEAIRFINDNYYNIAFDINARTANIDGETVNITDLFDISDEYLEELIKNDKFNIFLSENLVGNIDYSKNSVTIQNPYSTKALLVKVSDKSVFNEYSSIISIEELFNDLYIIRYTSALDTKNGFNDLKENNKVDGILTDFKLPLSSNNVSLQSVNSLYSASDKEPWGTVYTGMKQYSELLNHRNNKADIKVAVLDTGVNSSHEVFNENTFDWEHAWNFLDSNNNLTDDSGHGTMCAGIIAQSTSDNIKIVPMKTR